MKEARRLAILTHHRNLCRMTQLWPWQRSVLNWILRSLPSEIGGTPTQDFGEHGTMLSGLHAGAASLNHLRQVLNEPTNVSTLPSGAHVAQVQSVPQTSPLDGSTVQQTAPELQPEGLNHPTVETVFQENSRTVLWLWCRHGHTGKSSLGGFLRRHPKVKAVILR